jgi:NTE family protein
MWRIKPPVLALGGGGARGFAHLGVLDVIDELGLKVCAMAGTSMGAVVGAMYLALGSASAAIERWREAFDQDLVPPVRTVRRRLVDAADHEHPLVQIARRIRSQVVVAFASHRTTVLDDTDLVQAFEFLLPDMDLSDLRCPMLAVATNLETGEVVWLDRGNLRHVLKASSAIPGILPAVTIGGRTLVDGGVVGEVPVVAARSLGWPVIGIDASMDLPSLREGDLVLDTMMRTQMMTARLLRERILTGAWAVIRPRVGQVTWADWDRFDDLIIEGRKAARKFLGVT